jgi:multidrug resistance efflux pump
MNQPAIRGKWLLFAGAAVVTGVAAGSLAVWRQEHQTRVSAKVETPKPQPPAVFTGSEVSLPGKVQAQKVVNVPVPVEGAIESFAVEVGQDVYQGQLLARIRNTRLDASLEAATAEIEKSQTRVQNTEANIIAARLEASRAEADAQRVQGEFDRADKVYQRQKLLFAEGATPRLTYEKSERDFNMLKDEKESKDALARQAEERVASLNRDLDTFKRMLDERSQVLEQAKADVSAGDLHSPVDGIVVARKGEPGEPVTRQTEDLFRIAVTLSTMEVVVEPSPPQLQRIKPGQAAAIHVAEMPNESIPGTVRQVSGAQVIVEFISPTSLIRPGVSAQVTIKLT